MRAGNQVLLIIGGALLVYGLIPVLFVYPFKPWASTMDFLTFVFLEDRSRFYWLSGIAVVGFSFFGRRNNSNVK
ncbi:hypothetical protein ACFSO0_18295 [Brevibacillus sp. GCM10020057]|uniref:hypothetical protein n=1 Tax=Brevibacillus sp. GCM10020057 TaxID=3317327 RepID=UPI0036275A70